MQEKRIDAMNLSNHPCFNDKVRHTFGRIHLPVAPRCNIQCRFCNRKFDCVNESRPGVTSGVLSPFQALAYLDEVMSRKKNISVVGIAGPGDPFANPVETIETLRRVRERYPDMLLCVASNGLNVAPYADKLEEIGVSHVTITVNAVDPDIASKIYAWVRYEKRVCRADKGAEILLKNQIAAVKALKERGLIVKINAIIIPGVNDGHIPAVAEKMAGLKADILNCIPYYPNKGAEFENVEEPSKEMIARIRKAAKQFMPQMHHCTRCRADAVGLLGEAPDPAVMNLVQQFEKGVDAPAPRPDDDKPYVAVASQEGVLVNQHLGEARELHIFERKDGRVRLADVRQTPAPGGGMGRWMQLAGIVEDCRALLVSGAGDSPRAALTRRGVNLHEVEGLIDDAVSAVFDGQSLNHMMKRRATVCGAACGGTGYGCG